jgi:site-specific DNA-adenine methylase
MKVKAINRIDYELEGEDTYIYVYLNKQDAIYVGKGTIGDKFRRAEDLKGHKGIDPKSVTAIHIIDACYGDQQKIVEQNHIEDFGGLEALQNRRREVSEKKYYKKMVEYHSRSKFTRKDLDKATEKAADGSDTAESEALAKEIIKHVDVREELMLVGNGGFGTVNMAKESLKEGIKNFTIVNTKYEHDKELTEMAQAEKVNYQVINEDFLERDFGDKKYDLILMNPPWAPDKKTGMKTGSANYKHDGGTDFIDKAVDLLEEGGKLVAINGYANFTYNRSNKIKNGSFRDLMNKGYFERIEVHSGADFGIGHCPFPRKVMTCGLFL